MGRRGVLALATLLILVGAALIAYGIVAEEQEGKAFMVILIGPFPIVLGYNATPEEIAVLVAISTLAVLALLLSIRAMSSPVEARGDVV